MELPENKQATYLMPAAPEVAEPGSAQDKKPQPQAPAVPTLLPATPAPIAAPAPVAARPHAASAERPQEAREGFWTRFKRMLAGEPAARAEPEPVAGAAPGGSARRDDGQRRDGRRDHSRHGRYAEGPRRDRGEGRRGDGRDRDRGRSRDGRDSRDMRDRDRDRVRADQARGGRDRSPERGAGERGSVRGEAGAPEENRQSTERAPAPMESSAPAGEGRSERGERSGRGRRGRRRGRRGGGGGMREGLAPPAGASGVEGAPPGNGSHDAPAAADAAPPPADHPREAAEPAPAREYHSEPRDSAGTHEAAPLAHFEPAPKPETNVGLAKPYVVWSSAPPKDVPREGPEE
jgi:ribonuclease E